MPLTPGSSRPVISSNIREMVNAGHPPKVAVAAALHNADTHPNDVGLKARVRTAEVPKIHPNDGGLVQRVKAAAPQPVQPNDSAMVGMAGLPGIGGKRNMTRTELHSMRGMKGRQPRA